MRDKIKVMENSRGRFIGVATTQGATMNARYIGSTDNYVRLFDRNSKQEVKMKKSSVASVTYAGETYA
jgi:hypothetical protein